MVTTASVEEALQPPMLTPGARRLLAVASDLFYRRGIHAVGVDTIAADSGVTKRTLYDRFESKDGLIKAYLQIRHQAWWEVMRERVASQPTHRVLAVWDSYVEDGKSADRGCAFINAAGELPRDHPAFAVIRAHKAAIRELLVNLIEADHPEIEKPKEMADQIFLLLEGGITHRGIDGDDSMLRQARAVAESLTSGRHTP